MKLVIIFTAIFGLLYGCAAQNNLEYGKPSAKKDTRGHRPQAMTGERLRSIVTKYGKQENKTLSWTEYNDWRENQFNTVDANHNSKVDAEEYVYEFEARLDLQLAEARKTQISLTHDRFSALDSDKSGLISWDEYAASGKKIFSRWDVNNDRVIDENDAAPETKHKKKRARSHNLMPSSHNKKGLLALYDANLDEIVSSDEFTNERRSRFYLADQDKSGALKQEEYLGEFEDRLNAALNKRRRASIKQTYVRFNVLDDDKNQEMTFAEFQISGRRIFDRWDKNQDGVVSAADVKKTGES